MSSKHFSSKGANVKLVQNRKPLVRAIALALMAGCVAVPAGAWAATIQGYKFIDRNHNGIKDNGEGLAGETINLKPTNAFASARPFGRLTSSDSSVGTDGRYIFNGLAKGSYKVWESATQPSGLQTSYLEANPQIVTIVNDTDVLNVDFRISPPRAEKTLTIGNGLNEVKIGRPVNLELSVKEATDTTPFQVTWDFGDGQTYGPIDATGSPLAVVADHYYYNTGDFTVAATVTYQDATTEVVTTTVKVKANSNPVVSITSPTSSGEPVEINAGDSYPLEATLTDLDAEDTLQLYYGIWDGGNYVWQQNAVTVPYALNVPYTVSDNHNGTLQAYVYAYDDSWGWAYDDVTLSSLGVKITAPTGDTLQTLEYGQPVEFTATVTDLEDLDKHQVYWSFGDGGWNSWKGTSVDGNPAEMTTSYTYAGGDFTAWVYAYDQNWSRWTSNRITFHVNGPANSNPTAEITASTATSDKIDTSTATSASSMRRGTRDGNVEITPVQVNRGETVNFEIKVSDLDTNLHEKHYVYIDFGDGGWKNLTIDSGNLPYTIPDVSHAYAGGNFTLRVYIYDDKGGWAQMELPIEVTGDPNANPTIEVTPLPFIRPGVPAEFDVNISDTDTFQTPLQAYLSFGDGTSIQWPNNEVPNPFTDPVYHTYSMAGSYEVWMYVYDNHGGWAYKQLTVTAVDNLLPQDATQTQLDAAKATANSVCDVTNANDYPVTAPVIWTDTDLANLTGKVIKIDASVTATLSITSTAPIEVDAICNHGTLIVNTPSEVVATKVIANYSDGVIQGVNGASSTTLHQDSGSDGSLVKLTSYNFNENGECIGLLFNEGTIHAGRGGDGYTQGGNGGVLDMFACTIMQNGFITAGNGGNGDAYQPAIDGLSNSWDYRSQHIYGGSGADLLLQGEDFFATPQSATSSGRGGDAKSWVKCGGGYGCSHPGNGGNLWITFTSEIQPTGTVSSARSLYFEPDIMLSGKGTKVVAEEDVFIFGGDNWQLKLNDLQDGAISAGRDIVIAVGKDGVVDLRGNASKVLKAGGKLKVYADNILLDEGVTLASLAEAAEIEVNPAKILYHATFTGSSEVRVKPSTTTPVSLTLANVGPTADTYKLSIQRVKKDVDPKLLEMMVPPFMSSQELKLLEDVSNAEGWTVQNLPATVTVEGLKQTELQLNVSAPATLDAQETFVVTAVSQTDPSVKATFEVDVKVAEQTQRVLVDSDNDGVADEFDAFPNDAKEWMDTDHDKVGNNADEDDDGDGMSDEWEKQYDGLYSTRYDADGDADKDGVSNLDEYKAGTNPVEADKVDAGDTGGSDDEDSSEESTDETSLVPSITLTKTGDGNGIVQSRPAGIRCGKTCGKEFPENSTVKLVAFANKGSLFTGWGGDCSGTTKKTTVTVDQALTCTAQFEVAKPAPAGMYNLTVSVEGEGEGIITANGINCAGDCQQNHKQGKNLVLKAIPDASSTFVGWSGDCEGTKSPLQVKLEQDMTCVATFQSK